MDLQWNADAFPRPHKDSENKHYYISSLRQAKKKLLADFPRKPELCAENGLWVTWCGLCTPFGSQWPHSDQAFSGPVELMAAALEWDVLEPGQGAEDSPWAAWRQTSEPQTIFQVVAFSALHLNIQDRSSLTTWTGQVGWMSWRPVLTWETFHWAISAGPLALLLKVRLPSCRPECLLVSPFGWAVGSSHWHIQYWAPKYWLFLS